MGNRANSIRRRKRKFTGNRYVDSAKKPRVKNDTH